MELALQAVRATKQNLLVIDCGPIVVASSRPPSSSRAVPDLAIDDPLSRGPQTRESARSDASDRMHASGSDLPAAKRLQRRHYENNTHAHRRQTVIATAP